MKKNVASQTIGAQMVSATDGSAFAGAVTVYVTGDAGVQAAGSVGSGACTHEGNGYHTYAPAQAETNYDLVAFTFTGTGAVPATVQVFTGYPQTGDSYARLGAPAGASVSADVAAVKSDTAAILTDTGTTLDAMIKDIPTVAEFEARTLPSADYTVASDLPTLDVNGNVSTVLYGTQPAVTFGQVKILANVAYQGALQITNENAEGDGVQTSGKTGQTNIGYTAGVKNLGDKGVWNLGESAGQYNQGTSDVIGIDAQATAAAILVTPANKLATAATGQAGLDFDNVKAASAPTTLTNITVPVVTDVGTVAGNVGNVLAIGGVPMAEGSIPGVAAGGAGGLAMHSDLSAVQAVTNKLDTAMVLDGAEYQFTANALEQSPAGGTGLTAQETADAVNNLAPASTGAAGSIRAKLDAIQLVTDEIDVSAVTLALGNNAGSLAFVVGSVFDETLTGLTTIPADWTECIFSLKIEKDRDLDAESLVQIKITNGGNASDGLRYLNRAAPVSPITKADASLTVTQATGTVRIVVSSAALALLTGGRSSLDWDLKVFKTDGWSKVVTSGEARIDWTPTRTT